MDNNHQNYDALCYDVLTGIVKTFDGYDRICLRCFNENNKEHLFLIALIIACRGIIKKPIAIDCKRSVRKKLTQKYPNDLTIDKIKKDDGRTLDVEAFLNRFRSSAEDCFGSDFTFGEVYDAYYAEAQR